MAFERPRTERKVNRIKSVYLFLRKNGPMGTKELSEEFGMHLRTLQRDLATLQLNELIEYNPVGTWHVTNKKVKQIKESSHGDNH
jgi:DeoR/GlpR family transcriptional regulator of sugar metabolism